MFSRLAARASKLTCPKTRHCARLASRTKTLKIQNPGCFQTFSGLRFRFTRQAAPQITPLALAVCDRTLDHSVRLWCVIGGIATSSPVPRIHEEVSVGGRRAHDREVVRAHGHHACARAWAGRARPRVPRIVLERHSMKGNHNVGLRMVIGNRA